MIILTLLPGQILLRDETKSQTCVVGTNILLLKNENRHMCTYSYYCYYYYLNISYL